MRKLIANTKKAIKQWKPEKPASFSFSFAAAERWKSIYSKFYARSIADDPLISVLSERMQNHCLKAAMIWAALDGVSVIDEQHLESGLAFADFLYNSLWTLFRGFGASPMAKLDQQIIEAVRNAGPLGIRQRTLKKRFWRTDAEVFNKRLYYLGMNDGPLETRKDGAKVFICYNTENEDAEVESIRGERNENHDHD